MQISTTKLDALAIELGEYSADNLEHLIDLHVIANGWNQDAKLGLLQRIVDARQQQESVLLKAYQAEVSCSHRWHLSPEAKETSEAYDQHLQESSAIRKLLGRVTRAVA